MKDIYAAITERFIEQLKQGTVPWQQPWEGAQNIVSKKPYRGINALMLGSSKFSSPYWMTFKQASELDGRINKGEKSTPVVYYKFLQKQDEHGNPVYGENGLPTTIPFIRWSNVFNLEQTSEIEPPKQTETLSEANSLERAAAIVANTDLCPIKYIGYQALYSPKHDEIRMPPPDTFSSPEEFYHTLFHEMTHATGAECRLNREGVTNRIRFGSERYSKEELIAELGAAFLSNEAGILDNLLFQNSAAYLQSWITKLEDDNRLIISAASAAQRSTDFVLGIQQRKAVTTDDVMPVSIELAEKHQTNEAILTKQQPQRGQKKGISI